jgi:hypothetical protein
MSLAVHPAAPAARPARRLGRRTATATVTVDGAGDGVTVSTVDRTDTRLGQGGVPFDRVAAQAYSSFADATVVEVGRTSNSPSR